MNVTFFGAGYVGLVSSVALASLGQNVTCIDNDITKIKILKGGDCIIHEKDLERNLKETLFSGHLRFSHDPSDCKNSEIIFVAVGTPSLPSGEADLFSVYFVLEEIIKNTSDEAIIVIKSTVPPTTSKKLQKYISDKNRKNEIAVNPEFLREGNAVQDFLNPDRIIIGTSSKRSKDLLEKVYKHFLVQGVQIVNTDLTTAEMIKYSSNCFLATKVSFVNEMSNLCEKIGANINLLTVGMGLDKRIGKEFLKPGPGFGGSCFPKDLLAIEHAAKSFGVPLKIIDSVISVNQERPYVMSDKIKNIVGLPNKNDKGITLGVLGLTYKAGTDDVRSSPSIKIIRILIDLGYKIKVYDPYGTENAKKKLSSKNIFFANTAEEVAESCDAVIIMTEWPEFNELNFKKIMLSMKSPKIIDLRNMLDRDLLTQIGFEYYGIGFPAL